MYWKLNYQIILCQWGRCDNRTYNGQFTWNYPISLSTLFSITLGCDSAYGNNIVANYMMTDGFDTSHLITKGRPRIIGALYWFNVIGI